MRIFFFSPRVVDEVVQNTTENEIARALRRRGCYVESIVAYRQNQCPMDGFSEVTYVKYGRHSLLNKIRLHGAALSICLNGDWNVIVLGYNASHLMPLVALARFLKGRPKLVLDIRSVPVDVARGIRGWVQERRYHLGVRIGDLCGDGLTTITPMLRDVLRRKLWRLRDRVGVWTSGVDLERFQPSSRSIKSELGLAGKRVVVYHGVLSPNRGLQNAIRAIALASSEMDALRFLVVGDGPGRQELEALARERGIADQVIFTGQRAYQEIPYYLAAADVGILPFPNIEWWAVSSPIKLMEYLAMGLPVVTTNIPAVRYVIEETGGAVCCESDEPDSLAEGIRAFYREGCEPIRWEVLEQTISWNEQGRRLLAYLDAL